MTEDLFDSDVPETTVRAQRHFAMIPVGMLRLDLSGSALRVYGILRAYARPGHATFPHMDTVCEEYNIAERTFKRGLQELRNAGVVKVSKRTNAGGFRRSNEYFFPDISDMPEMARPQGPELARTYGPELARPEEVEKKEVEKSLGVAKATRQKRPVVFPAEFSVTTEMVTWARKEVPLVLDLRSETGKFSDWARANAKKYTDWTAAWRNWMRNAQKYRAEEMQRRPQLPPLQTGMTKDDVKKMFAEEGWEYGE